MKISITDFSAPIRASVFKFRDTFRYSKCNVKMKIKMISLFTYDFSTLYTTSPHNLIKDINVLKEPFREKALLTLHVMHKMHFLLQKTLKNIMHGNVKMYVMP